MHGQINTVKPVYNGHLWALVTGNSLMQLKSNAESSHMSLLICINVSSIYKSADYLYKLHNTQCPHYTLHRVDCTLLHTHTKDDFVLE